MVAAVSSSYYRSINHKHWRRCVPRHHQQTSKAAAPRSSATQTPSLHCNCRCCRRRSSKRIDSLLQPLTYLQHRLCRQQGISNHQLCSLGLPVLIDALKQRSPCIKHVGHCLLMPLVEADVP